MSEFEQFIARPEGMAIAGLLIVLLASIFLSLWLNRRSQQRQRLALETLQQTHQQQLDGLQGELTGLQTDNRVLETQRNERDQRLATLSQQLSAEQQQSSERAAKLSALATELNMQREANADQLKTLEETRQKLARDFEILANRIFEEKTQRFTQNSQSTIATTISPLREQLKDFKQRVEDIYDKDSKERISLQAELGQLKQLNQQMSTDAVNLTNALKGDNKAQGNWGEVILERVLEESGLQKGREYEVQQSFSTAEGRSQPDVIVRLPEEKDLIIDSKVSLLGYERYCSADSEVGKKQALKQHIDSVRAHIKALSNKNYEGIEGLRTLDFVLIFIPIEPAFMAAFEQDQSMFREAYEKNIIVVSPTTLLATLRTIQSIWRYENQNKNAEEIARQAGAMHDKFVGFIADMEKIAEQLNRASQTHEQAMSKLSTGRGNLVGSTQRLEKLGAKVKKTLPEQLLPDGEHSD